MNVYILSFFSAVSSDLGVHVDGFISNVAHSFVVGANKVCARLFSLCFPSVLYETQQPLPLFSVCHQAFFLSPSPLSQDNPVTGRKADVIKAAHLCAEAALRLVKPGNQVSEGGWKDPGDRAALWDGLGGCVLTSHLC